MNIVILKGSITKLSIKNKTSRDSFLYKNCPTKAAFPHLYRNTHTKAIPARALHNPLGYSHLLVTLGI